MRAEAVTAKDKQLEDEVQKLKIEKQKAQDDQQKAKRDQEEADKVKQAAAEIEKAAAKLQEKLQQTIADKEAEMKKNSEDGDLWLEDATTTVPMPQIKQPTWQLNPAWEDLVANRHKTEAKKWVKKGLAQHKAGRSDHAHQSYITALRHDVDNENITGWRNGGGHLGFWEYMRKLDGL